MRFQINTLFRGLSRCWRMFHWRSANARASARDMLRSIAAHRATLEHAYALLQQLRIADDALTPVHALPTGKQRLVEIAIALGLRPTVLLLDEPAAGVRSAESAIIFDDVIDQLPKDIAVLIIEHDMELVFRFRFAASPFWCRAPRADRRDTRRDCR